MWVPEASCGSWITEGMQVGEAVVLSEDVYILNMPGGYLHIYLKRLNFAQSLYFLRRRNSLHWLNHTSKCSFCVVVPVVYNSSFDYLIIIELFQKPMIYSLQKLLPVEFFQKARLIFLKNLSPLCCFGICTNQFSILHLEHVTCVR